MKRTILSAAFASTALSFSAHAFADGEYSWRWLSDTVGAPVAHAVGSAENTARSLIGAGQQPAKLDLAALEKSAPPSCSEMPLPPGATIDLGFSPEGTAEAKVLKAIHEAASGPGEHSLLVEGYEFTSFAIAKAVVAAKDAGAKVAVIADVKENQKKASKVGYLVAHGVQVREDHHLEMLHDKILIVNGETTEVGSFNYTNAAASREHAENALIVRHAPNVAECYIGHWKRVWDESTPVS
ncbi:phospholipase D-like domain-containing protein [Paraburkholderia youngii]|uniref:phospholipase D-like domain-containing protein n=1 Tax=Paraburkholderia youngii TaxID=2782701 RepID=UPI003D229BCF